MALTQSRRARWDPFKEFRALDRRFSRFGWPFVTEKGEGWSPLIDVLEKDGEVLIKAELPGMTKDEVKVSLDEDSVVISGERKSESETKEEDYYICERSYGSFYRRIPLPAQVDTAKAAANFADGVLTVKVPVVRPVSPRHVDVPVN